MKNKMHFVNMLSIPSKQLILELSILICWLIFKCSGNDTFLKGGIDKKRRNDLERKGIKLSRKLCNILCICTKMITWCKVGVFERLDIVQKFHFKSDFVGHINLLLGIFLTFEMSSRVFPAILSLLLLQLKLL